MGKDCDGNCNYGTVIWRVIMNKAFRRNYSQRYMYLCGDCIQDLFGGTWTGGGPFQSDVKKIVKIRIKKIGL